MIVYFNAIDFDIEQKRAQGNMYISHEKDSNDWIFVEYECDLVTYHQQAEYCDGYLIHGAADICENVENVRYQITEKGCDVRSCDNVQDIIAEYVVQKANFKDTPDLFTYKGKGKGKGAA